VHSHVSYDIRKTSLRLCRVVSVCDRFLLLSLNNLNNFDSLSLQTVVTLGALYVFNKCYK